MRSARQEDADQPRLVIPFTRRDINMRKLIGPAFATAIVCALASPATAEDNKEVVAVLDKAIKAMGGEEKLAAVKAVTLKVKGKLRIMDNDREFSSQGTMEGLDRARQDFQLDSGGNTIKSVTVLNGDKCWRVVGDMKMEVDKDGVANHKRAIYLVMIPTTIVPLKSKDYKAKVIGEVKVDDKPAVGIEVTAPDGKDFKLYFDKENGLPVKQVAKVAGLTGGEFNQETTYSGYKHFGGIKKATKFEVKRDGQRFSEVEVIEFKVLDKVDAKTFDEPK
jgi:hypothetical protein